MQELEKKYTIQYLFPEHKRDYHHWQVKGRIIWVEWAHKFAKEVAKKKWNRKNVIVRLHRYELDTTYMNEINWDNVDQLIFVNPELEKDFYLQELGMEEVAFLRMLRLLLNLQIKKNQI